MTKRRGRPPNKPKRITVTVSHQNGETLQLLAEEANVTTSALCAHVLERYAIQDHELMTNDVLVQRLSGIHDRHMQEFADRFGDVILRQAHEIVALRRQIHLQTEAQSGKEKADELKGLGWQHAVRSLRRHTQKIRGEDAQEPARSESDPR